MAGMAVGRPTEAQLDAMLARLAGRAVTYDHVGSTMQPDGGGRPRYWKASLDVGRGRGDFERAVLGLHRWAAHRHIGATVHPPDASLVEGCDLVVMLKVGPFTALAPDRVVAVVEEPDRVAFAYGTLPGHPEIGEENFAVTLEPDETVRCTIGVDAKPANVVMWIGAPVVKRMQRQALHGYLAGIAAFVADRSLT